jgi:hypothetical protein
MVSGTAEVQYSKADFGVVETSVCLVGIGGTLLTLSPSGRNDRRLLGRADYWFSKSLPITSKLKGEKIYGVVLGSYTDYPA